jgi:hypothetical protein
MKRFKFIIPIMIVVLVLAIWYLNKEYTEVPMSSRIMISIGGSILSGIISFFLLKKDTHEIDPKPTTQTQKKRP